MNRLRLSTLGLTLLATACGDSSTTSASASATSTAGDTSSTGTPTTGTTAEPTSTTSMSSETGGGTQGETGSTGTTGAVGSTGPVGTTAACTCTPGDVLGCDGGDLSVCADDCQTAAPQPCPNPGEACQGGACVMPAICTPGAVECEGDAVKTCNDQGDFDPPVACPQGQTCSAGKCLSACEQVLLQPSSVGCSFFANRMDNYDNSSVDSLVVGNTSKMQVASVQLYFTPNGGVEQPEGAAIKVQPGGTYTFMLSNQPLNKVSAVRKGGTYRVQSDIPIIAYQHSPIGAIATNDASMLLPEHALRQNYVIASYTDWLSTVGDNQPSYFNVIAAENDTTVSWTPQKPTLAGNGVPAVGAGQTGMVKISRGDLLQVRAPGGGDVSGTIVSADKPIWVVGAVTCVNVPSGVTYCDHVEEQMLPLDYWGKTYVGAHSPLRGGEQHHWRVYGGEDGVVVSTVPAQPGTPMTLNKGQWKDLVVPTGTSFMFEGTGPFLPVQYLEGTDGGAGTGDPAMYQMIPVEQFLDRYAFVTGQGYSQDYAQVIRLKGGADVLVDGKVVTGYYTVGAYEVSDWLIQPGAHLAESDQPFGILQIGYTDVTSYAYPGGMQLEIINPQ
jgi:hypothetical protein